MELNSKTKMAEVAKMKEAEKAMAARRFYSFNILIN